MKIFTTIKRIIILFFYCCTFSCENFVEVDVPDSKIVSEVVFNNDETAIGAMKGIYNELYRSSFSNGSMSSVTVLGSLSSNNIKVIGTTNLNELEFEQKEITTTNSSNLALWSSAYSIIYMTNSLLEGVAKSESLTSTVKHRLEGESKFVRAFTYFYLVNLYGDVPLILTTNYQNNAVAKRSSRKDIFQLIITDLKDAVSLLKENYIDGERTYITKFVAKALLARILLYQNKWKESEIISGEVIAQSGTYKVLQDLDQVFLANSQESIWQISTIGRGSSLTNTNEGSVFIIDPQSASSRLRLTNEMVDVLQKKDKRLSSWVGKDQETNLFYPTKYKIRNSTGKVTEYSMVLRLAEQFLIRAEARTMQGNLTGAIKDLDVIRERAGIELVANTYPGISKAALLDTIMKERRRELFTEWGHRWLDVRRLGKSNEIFGTENLQWKETDTLYPIPEEERIKNPYLDQNLGY